MSHSRFPGCAPYRDGRAKLGGMGMSEFREEQALHQKLRG